MIVGKGPFEKNYKKRAEDLDCEDVVKFIGFRKDVADLMSTADVFVLPSLSEALGSGICQSSLSWNANYRN